MKTRRRERAHGLRKQLPLKKRHAESAVELLRTTCLADKADKVARPFS